MTTPPTIEFKTIRTALQNAELPPADLIIGIGSGGVVLASMAACITDTPMIVLWLAYRDKNNIPIHANPQLVQDFTLPKKVNRVILVDDVVVTGKTLKTAKDILFPVKTTSLALMGAADIILFPDLESCVQWPWNPVRSIA